MGRVRLVLEQHTGLFRGKVALFGVATSAGGGQVVPAGFAPPAARNDVVNGEVAAHPATVLAGVVVAPKDIAPAKRKPPSWAAHHAFYPDNTRYWVRTTGGMKRLCAFHYHFSHLAHN